MSFLSTIAGNVLPAIASVLSRITFPIRRSIRRQIWGGGPPRGGSAAEDSVIFTLHPEEKHATQLLEKRRKETNDAAARLRMQKVCGQTDKQTNANRANGITLT